MKIINSQINTLFAQASHKLCVGFVTGPIRVIGAVVQIALNGVAAIFSALPTALGYLNPNHPFHVKHLGKDCYLGLLHIWRGILETLPGSSFCIDMFIDGRMIVLISDHPFRGVIED